MFAYIGSEGYLANLELREGKQHCQKGTPQFLEETISLCRRLSSCFSGLIPDMILPKISASSWSMDAISSLSTTSVRKAKRTGWGWQKTIPLTSHTPGTARMSISEAAGRKSHIRHRTVPRSMPQSALDTVSLSAPLTKRGSFFLSRTSGSMCGGPIQASLTGKSSGNTTPMGRVNSSTVS